MSSLKKIKVAITGNIGSGKSTFTKYLFEAGYPVILADDISKEILASDPKLKSEIIQEFGAQSFLGKKINKQYLSEEIFSNPKKLKKINSIIHPRVIKRIEHISDEYFKTNSIVFIEAALIFESKMEKMFDYIVLITSDIDLRKKRSTSSQKFTEEDFIKRENSQMGEDAKKKKAHFIFTNDGTKNDLKQKANLLINLLTSTLK